MEQFCFDGWYSSREDVETITFDLNGMIGIIESEWGWGYLYYGEPLMDWHVLDESLRAYILSHA